MNIRTGKILLLVMILLFLTASAACGKPEKKLTPPNQKSQETNQKPKEPKELSQITKDIETILKDASKKQETAQPTAEKSPMEDWKTADKSVLSIHQKWNAVEVAAVKAGADDTLRNNFETRLYELTDSIMAHDILGTAENANELYRHSLEVAALFKTTNPPQADLLKYQVQKILISVDKNNWQKAGDGLTGLTAQWEKVKTTLVEKGGKLTAPMDYAIRDLSDALEIKNKEVAKIKGQIVLKHIEKIIKEMSKSS